MTSIIIITCDKCNPMRETHGRNGAGYVTDDRARDLGWKRMGDRDWCPDCLEKRKGAVKRQA